MSGGDRVMQIMKTNCTLAYPTFLPPFSRKAAPDAAAHRSIPWSEFALRFNSSELIQD